MSSVHLKPALNKDIAILFGGKITIPMAERIASRAKALADARAKHSSIAGDISVGVHAHGSHAHVRLSVIGYSGLSGMPTGQIASHLEFGYYNEWAHRWLAGKHIMRDAKYAA